MKKELYQEIEIPKGVDVELVGSLLTIKGPEGENKREFRIKKLELKKEGDTLIVGNKKASKNEKKLMNTIAAHIRNMILGVNKKFEYKLKICYSHFPITVEKKGEEVSVKNFIGEKVPRRVIIPQGVEVDLGKEIITVQSSDKELAGQFSASLEKLTRIRRKDRRIFQDGIFIISKNGKEI
ncbi:50S ribosomal protein L6 [Patescibacteria group bacterium]|nr:50S ribosomal protein L6 [Patescibacteria group bacterium]